MMDWTIEQYLNFVQHLLEQRDQDKPKEEPIEEPVYWC
jgi:hypothetical protein